MSQPPQYDRQFNFQNQQSLTPADPIPADELDSEFNSIKITLDATLANLDLLQRDDGELGNETVGVDQLKPELEWIGTSLVTLGQAVTDAEAAATAAIAAKTAAETAENHAETAETNAETAETNAAASAAAAAIAKTASELAETHAELAETNAELAQTNAETAETNAETALAAAVVAQVAAEAAAAKLSATSTTPVAIALGSNAFATQAGKFFDPGTWLLITSNAAPTVDFMHGQVTAYSGTSLTVNVTSIGGSGTHSDWTIRVSGTRGAEGTAGPTGVQFAFASSTADSDPGAGTFRLNHATPASATAAYVDNVEHTGVDVSAWLNTLDDTGDSAFRGVIRFMDPITLVFHMYSVTGSVVDGTGYRKLALTYLTGAGAFTVGNVNSLTFFARGPIGATGATGATGVAEQWHTGSTDPGAGLGADGDLYLQTAVGSVGVVGSVWEKAVGTWAIVANIRGASGAGTGDVIGPASSTDNAITRFDLATGKLVQNSTVIVSDTGAVTGVAALTTSGIVTVGTTAATAPLIDPSGFLQVPEIAAPATPASGFVRVYAKSDNKVYRKDDGGVETELGGSTVAAASTTVAGIVELATDAEARTGTDTVRAITPSNLPATFGRGRFHVHRNGVSQTGMTAGVVAKIQFTTEDVDEAGWFDNATNYRYTPQEAGWYWIYLSVRTTCGTSGETPQGVIRKNGSTVTISNYMDVTGATVFATSVGALIFLNGSSDYIEGYVYMPAGQTTFLGITTGTFMSGWKVGT